MDNMEFLLDWFGRLAGREVGNPSRIFIDMPLLLKTFMEECTKLKKPCFMSVNPYKKRDIVYGLEKLFFDFDSKEKPPNLKTAWNETSDFAKALRKWYGIEAFIVFSGNRGYHVYVFFNEVITFTSDQERLAKDVAQNIQQMLLAGCNYKTLDYSSIGDIKRLSRVPYSIHEKTGKPCLPMEDNLERAKQNGIQKDFVKFVVQKVENRPKLTKATPLRIEGKARPCILDALGSKHIPHSMRFAIALEFLNNGYNVEKVVELFSHQEDFDEKKSTYQVTRAQRKGYKPYKCESLMQFGCCLGDKCPIFLKRVEARHMPQLKVASPSPFLIII